MDTPIRAAAEFQRLLDKRRWKYCFIGGIAVQKWGEPRFTADVDLAILTSLGKEELIIDELLKLFQSRVSNPRSFAIQNRVLLLRTADGIDLDISLAAFAFEESAISRARKVTVIPGVRLRLCTAEDLIVYKAFAGRKRDWADVESVIAKQRGRLDWSYIGAHLAPLAELKEDPEIMPELQELRRIIESDESI
jgi:predicted nucleotidyltransferase